jgi:hypothetical protein
MSVRSGSGHRPLILPALAAAALTLSLTGCGSWSDYSDGGYTTQNYYAVCVDPYSGQVVSMAQCQLSPNYYYVVMTPSYYRPGAIVPITYRTGSGYFRYNDSSARSRIGLPATGGIKSGSRVISRSGGFDAGHVGSHAGGSDGGSGGHGSGGHGAAGAGHGSGGG